MPELEVNEHVRECDFGQICRERSRELDGVVDEPGWLITAMEHVVGLRSPNWVPGLALVVRGL